MHASDSLVFFRRTTRCQKLVVNGARKLLLNLADLTQIDSSGVSIIVETYVSLRGKGAI